MTKSMPTPKKDLNAILIMVRHLQRGPRTVDDLIELLNVSERTIYRWLRHLEEEGFDLISRRNPDQPGKAYYSILKKS